MYRTCCMWVRSPMTYSLCGDSRAEYVRHICTRWIMTGTELCSCHLAVTSLWRVDFMGGSRTLTQSFHVRPKMFQHAKCTMIWSFRVCMFIHTQATEADWTSLSRTNSRHSSFWSRSQEMLLRLNTTSYLSQTASHNIRHHRHNPQHPS